MNFRFAALASALLLGLAGCATQQAAVSSTPAAPITAAYTGLFISNCSSVNEKLYSADALQLKPRDEKIVDAQYIKVFFRSPNCDRPSQLIKFEMPAATWEFIGQTLIDGKMVEQVIVNLPQGQLKGTIADDKRVKATKTSFLIQYGDAADDVLPLEKETDLSVEKELRYIDGNKLYFSDPGLPLSADGFPTGLLPPEDFMYRP